MYSKTSLLIIAIMAAALTTMGTLLPSTSLVWAVAGIVCNGTNPCNGTNSDDKMKGDDQDNKINGKSGDDSISGLAGKDIICGGAGDDKIAGGDGDDRILPDVSSSQAFCESGFSFGADKISGGAGDDEIWSGKETFATQSDGQKDIIDCGPGDDTALINEDIDHDEAVNCEHFTV
jgi:Ca2+-binding RTX toxin-like protein